MSRFYNVLDTYERCVLMINRRCTWVTRVFWVAKAPLQPLLFLIIDSLCSRNNRMI